jgi:hypothetical protein
MTGITDEMIDAGVRKLLVDIPPEDLTDGTLAQLRRNVLGVVEAVLAGRPVVVPEPQAGEGVDVLATKYDVSVLPRDDINRSAWSITVAYRGADKYAVLIRDHWCLSRDGTSEIEPTRDDRTDEWLADHRFTRDEALRLAVEHAPNVRCNGKTATELLEWLRERDASGVAGGDTQ